MDRRDEFLTYLHDRGAIEAPLTDLEKPDFCPLIEELIEERELLSHLASFYELPPAGYGDGLYVEQSLWSEVDLNLIREHEIIPVRRRDKGIDLLSCQSLSAQVLETLSDHFGATLRPYIWPRPRYLQARHVLLGDQLPAKLRDYLRHHPIPMGFARPQDLALDSAIATCKSIGAEDWENDDLNRFIEGCFDRDALLKVFLGRSARWLSPRILAVHQSGGLKPYFVEDCPQIDEVLKIPGNLRDIEAKDQSSLFEALDVDVPDEIQTIPLEIGGRKALSLLGAPIDRDSTLRLDTNQIDDQSLNYLQDLAALVGEQLTRLIRLAKSDELPPPEERIPALPTPRRQRGLGAEDSLVDDHLAQKGRKTKRHRWEIIDISEASDSSLESDSQPSDISELSVPSWAEESSAAQDSSVIEAVADALSSPQDLTQSSQAMLTAEPSEATADVDDEGAIRSTDGHPIQTHPDEDPEKEQTSLSEASRDLRIPNGPSGMPLAQILRRPKNVRKAHQEAREQRAKTEAQPQDDSPEDFTSGKTSQGTGQVKALNSSSTMQIHANPNETQHFGLFLQEMSSEVDSS